MNYTELEQRLGYRFNNPDLHRQALTHSRADSPEFTALELREALTHLGEITGAIDTEDVLGAIFSSFCLGK